MTSVPFPTFRLQSPVDVTNNRGALLAVGRCRIYPENLVREDYQAIVDKTIEQADAEMLLRDKQGGNLEETKKVAKKYMKQGVAMAKTYLQSTLQLDVSVIDVEIVVDTQDLIRTNGCIASCFLDAGCDKIVTDGQNLEALDAARVPTDRLVAHLVHSQQHGDNLEALVQKMQHVSHLCSSCSVDLTDSTLVSENVIRQIFASTQNVTVLVNPRDCSDLLDSDLASLVGNTCQGASTTHSDGGRISLVDPTAQQLGLAFAACIKTDREDGLYTTVVCARNGEALGLVYSSKESIIASLECARGVYYSRSRKSLWRKGDTSGHYQTLHRIDVDCDGDALRFTVTQRGHDHAAFCHLNTLTCWGKPRGLRHLEETLQDRLKNAPEGSYTKRLFDDDELLRNKLVEEAQELSEADTKQHVAEELSDLLYFAMVRAVKAGVSLDDAVAELDARARKVTRRPGDSKAFRIAAGKAILDKSKS